MQEHVIDAVDATSVKAKPAVRRSTRAFGVQNKIISIEPIEHVSLKKKKENRTYNELRGGRESISVIAHVLVGRLG